MLVYLLKNGSGKLVSQPSATEATISSMFRAHLFTLNPAMALVARAGARTIITKTTTG